MDFSPPIAVRPSQRSLRRRTQSPASCSLACRTPKRRVTERPPSFSRHTGTVEKSADGIVPPVKRSMRLRVCVCISASTTASSTMKRPRAAVVPMRWSMKASACVCSFPKACRMYAARWRRTPLRLVPGMMFCPAAFVFMRAAGLFSPSASASGSTLSRTISAPVSAKSAVMTKSPSAGGGSICAASSYAMCQAALPRWGESHAMASSGLRKS